MNQMKTFFFLFALLFPIFALCDEDWIYVNRDEKVNHFQLNSKGKLHYNDQMIENFSVQQKANRLAISPFSPDGKFAVVFSFGDQDSQCALLQMEKHSATTLSLAGTPVVWNSWSAAGPYLLLSTYTDLDNSLYSVSLATNQARKIPIQLQKSGEKEELDTTTVNWTSPSTFEITAFIHCASCDSKQEEKVIRSYKLTVNAESLEVKSEEQPLPPEE
jgi:hypothetical protein